MSAPRQDSLTEQLWTVKRLAVNAGCYDAADFIDRAIGKRSPYREPDACEKCDHPMADHYDTDQEPTPGCAWAVCGCEEVPHA